MGPFLFHTLNGRAISVLACASMMICALKTNSHTTKMIFFGEKRRHPTSSSDEQCMITWWWWESNKGIQSVLPFSLTGRARERENEMCETMIDRRQIFYRYIRSWRVNGMSDWSTSETLSLSLSLSLTDSVPEKSNAFSDEPDRPSLNATILFAMKSYSLPLG